MKYQTFSKNSYGNWLLPTDPQFIINDGRRYHLCYLSKDINGKYFIRFIGMGRGSIMHITDNIKYRHLTSKELSGEHIIPEIGKGIKQI